MKTAVFTLPSWILAYFINNDCSHMSDTEIKQADDFIKKHKIISVFMPENEYPDFRYRNDLTIFADNCFDCVCHIQ